MQGTLKKQQVLWIKQHQWMWHCKISEGSCSDAASKVIVKAPGRSSGMRGQSTRKGATNLKVKYVQIIPLTEWQISGIPCSR